MALAAASQHTDALCRCPALLGPVASDLIPAEAVLGLMAESWLSALDPFADSAATGGADIVAFVQQQGRLPPRQEITWGSDGQVDNVGRGRESAVGQRTLELDRQLPGWQNQCV